MRILFLQALVAALHPGALTQDAEDMLARERKKIAKQEEALRRNPSDANAAAAVGAFLCLMADDWVGGLPLLAKGSDKTLSDAAAKDLGAESHDHVAWISVGDAWWEIGARRTGVQARNAAGRAAHWWRRALPKLDKASRAKIIPKVEKWLKARGPFTAKVPANAAKTDAGVDLFEGEKVRFQVTGKWCINENPDREAWCDYKGYAHMRSKLVPMPDEPVCALLGRVGEGVPFSVSRADPLDIAISGRLFLGPNASPSDTIPGEMIVLVTVQF
jgi:hypothetical protein